jgi:DNA-binding MarR family transcriptional regulator
MTGSSQSPRDRILWILANDGEKIERSRLRRRMAMKYAELDPILKKMVKEGRIRISDEMIALL